MTGRVFEFCKSNPHLYQGYSEVPCPRNYNMEKLCLIHYGIDDRLACRHQISKCLVCILWSDLKFFFGARAPSLIHILMAEDQRESKEDET